MRPWRCELPISRISINIVLINRIFVNVHFFIGGFDTLLPQSQSMPNGSREVQQRMPESDAESTSYRIYDITECMGPPAGFKQDLPPHIKHRSRSPTLVIVDGDSGEPRVRENPWFDGTRMGKLS